MAACAPCIMAFVEMCPQRPHVGGPSFPLGVAYLQYLWPLHTHLITLQYCFSADKGVNLVVILMTDNRGIYPNHGVVRFIEGISPLLFIFSLAVTVPGLVTALPVILLIDSDTINWQLQNVSNRSRNCVCHRLAKHRCFFEKHNPSLVQVWPFETHFSLHWTEIRHNSLPPRGFRYVAHLTRIHTSIFSYNSYLSYNSHLLSACLYLFFLSATVLCRRFSLRKYFCICSNLQHICDQNWRCSDSVLWSSWFYPGCLTVLMFPRCCSILSPFWSIESIFAQHYSTAIIQGEILVCKTQRKQKNGFTF